MGQNVNYLLGNQSSLLGADPEQYRQQLIQQEQQRVGALAPNMQLGATLGGILGRGIGNVANDRGFFEVTNPVLQKLTQIQGIYSSSMQDSDPNDPLSFYNNLQKNFASAGLGQQALMASVEAKKFEDTGLKSQQLKDQIYKENLPLLDAQIAKARDAGNDKLADQLAQQRGQIQVKIDYDRAKELADINYKNAATKAQTATAAAQIASIEAGKSEWKPISEYDGGPPVAFAVMDKKTRKITYEKIGGGEYIPPVKPPGGAGAGDKTGKVDLSTGDKYFSNNTPASSSTPRQVGPVEQMSLDRLAKRKQEQDTTGQAQAAQATQGRADYNSLVQAAAQQGFVPMGMSGSEIVFINPTTGQQVTGSQL